MLLRVDERPRLNGPGQVKIYVFECDNCKKEFGSDSTRAKQRQRQGRKHFCSKNCENNFVRIVPCVNCSEEFPARNRTQKYCSDTCFKTARLEKTKERQNKPENRITKICLYCGKTFDYAKRNRERKFCDRSCGSKYYIENGTFDEWKNHTEERKGKELPCPVCGKLLYNHPRYLKRGKNKICKGCAKEWSRLIFSNKQPWNFGKKLSDEERTLIERKKIETLKKRYGEDVTNGFHLSRHTFISKPEKWIYEFLKAKFMDLNISNSQSFSIDHKRYFPDICFSEFRLIIEYYGDYWHANPAIHNPERLIEKKELTAAQIWKEDKERLEILKKHGYEVHVVWEKDFKERKDEILNELIELIERKKKQHEGKT